MSLRSLAAALLLAAGLLVAAAPEVAAQCAMCGTALSNSEEGRAIGADFNRAILLMLVAPYLVFGSFVAVIFRRRLVGLAQQLLARLRRPPQATPQTAS